MKLKERMVEWGGAVYSYEPPQYITDTDIIFEQIEDVQYFNQIIGEKLKKDTQQRKKLVSDCPIV